MHTDERAVHSVGSQGHLTTSDFLDVIRCFLAENNVANIGPYKLWLFQTQGTGEQTKGPILTLKGELR